MVSLNSTHLLCCCYSYPNAVIEEHGVRLKLNIVDTPGYGDQVNNENWYVVVVWIIQDTRETHCSISWEPIVKYIKDQHSAYLRKELTAQRDRYITDSRVHCCLFFITPSGHSYVSFHYYLHHVIFTHLFLSLGSSPLTLWCCRSCQKLSMSFLWLLNRIVWPWRSVMPLDNV